MRLTDEKIADVKEYLNRSIKVTASSLIPQLSKYGLDLIDTIEALQQENERLNAALDKAVDMIGESRCPTDYRLRKCSDYETCLHCWKDWLLGGKEDD